MLTHQNKTQVKRLQQYLLVLVIRIDSVLIVLEKDMRIQNVSFYMDIQTGGMNNKNQLPRLDQDSEDVVVVSLLATEVVAAPTLHVLSPTIQQPQPQSATIKSRKLFSSYSLLNNSQTSQLRSWLNRFTKILIGTGEEREGVYYF
ncbi:unnamed protein product, partial [Brassica rapa subsp. trilocularis]